MLGDVQISGCCPEVYVKCRRGSKRIHVSPTWILLRLMTVYGRGTIAKHEAIWSRGEV